MRRPPPGSTGSLTLLLAFALSGCTPPEAPPPATAAPPCPSGEILDGEICVAARCARGPWGELERDEDTLHVAAWGDSAGDGSEDRPLRQIAPAVDLAVEGGRSAIVVAAGEYDGHLVFGPETAGLSLRGRCSELVILQGVDRQRQAISLSSRADLRASGLTMRGASQGVIVWGGITGTTAFDGEDLVVEACLSNGFGTDGNAARLTLRDVAVRSCPADELGDAFGLWIDGGRAVVSGLEIDGIEGVGVFASGPTTELELSDATIARVAPAERGTGGMALAVLGGATVTATRTSLFDLVGAGVLVEGAHSRLDAVQLSVERVQPAGGGLGRGVAVQEGGSLTVDGLLIRDVQHSGLEGSGGAWLDVSDATIEDVRAEEDAEGGVGITLWGGAALVGDGIQITRPVLGGLFVEDDTTTADVADLVVRDVIPSGLGLAHAVQISGGASLVARDLLIEDSPDSGVGLLGGSSAVLERPTVRNLRPGPNPDSGAACFVAQGEGTILLATDLVAEGCAGLGLASFTGARFEVRGGLVSDPREGLGSAGRGVSVQDGATLVAEDLQVEGHREIGILLSGGSTLQFERVAVGSPSADAATVGGLGIQLGEGSSMVGSDLLLDGNRAVGLQVSASTASVDGLTAIGTRRPTEFEAAMGLAVNDGGVLIAQRVRIEDNDTLGVVVVDPGSRVELSDGAIRSSNPASDGSFGMGLQVFDDGTAVLQDMGLSDLHNMALFADGSRLELRDVTVERVRRGNRPGGATGVIGQQGASLELVDVTLREVEGPGLYLFDSLLHCTSCAVQDTEFAGIATLGGELIFEGGSVQDVAPNPDLGGGVGLYAWRNPAMPVLTLIDTLIAGTVGPAVYLRGSGRYDFDGVVMTDPASPARAPGFLALEGVLPWNGTTGLRLQGGSVSGFGHVGLLLEASGAQLDGVSFSDLAGVDVFRQHCADELPLDVLSGAPTVQACDGAPYDTEPALSYQIDVLDFLEVEP